MATDPSPPVGYNTEEEAWVAFDATSPATSPTTARHLGRLRVAVARAGAELGAYDDRVLVWLAGWEPEVAAVVASLIERASARRQPSHPAHSAVMAAPAANTVVDL
jgi:hypothetical protein